MKILLLCDEYPPYPTGGIGTVVKNIAEQLVKNGNSVYVVGYYRKNSHLEKYSIINGVHIYRYDAQYNRNIITKNIFKILKKYGLANYFIQKEVNFFEQKIQEIIKNNQIDIFEITDYYLFNNIATRKLIFKKFPIPTVLRIHGCVSFIQDNLGKVKSISKENDNLHFQRCDYISAVSSFSLKYIEENFDTNFFKGKCIIYNPIEDEFLNKKYNTNNNNNNNDILFVGKLTESKGCYALIKVFNRVAYKFPNINLSLIGGGDIEFAKSLLNKDLYNRVRFYGHRNRDFVLKSIDQCLFACIPSFFETFGMVAIEVMARGKTVIYTNRTVGPEIVSDNYNGFLVDPTNLSHIEEKITILLSDKDKLSSMSLNAYKTVASKFVMSKIIIEVETFYKSILNKYDIKKNN